MPAKHPEDVRLLAVAMARMVGAEQTADDLAIDVRTIKSWVAQAPPRTDITDDEQAWIAAERGALYRNLRALARGEVRDTMRLNNLAGTARDKLFRWATRREAHQSEQPEQPPVDPIKEQVDRLGDLRQRLFRNELDLELRQRGSDEPEPAATPETPEAALASWTVEVDRLLAMTDEQVTAEIERIDAELAELDRGEREQLEAELAARHPLPPPPAERPAPPSAPVSEAPRRIPAVVDVYEQPNTWRPWE